MSTKILLFLTLSISCQSVHDKHKDPADELGELAPARSLIDAANLTCSLTAEDYAKDQYSGLMLIPDLDPNATYIDYEICGTDDPDEKCAQGKMDGLMNELVFDAPYGNIEIYFKPCIPASRALAEECGSDKVIRTTHMVPNSMPSRLGLTAQGNPNGELQKKSKMIESLLKKYSQGSKTQDSFDSFVTNLLSVDSMILARLYRSSTFQSHIQSVRNQLKNTKIKSRGMGILSLGSSSIGQAFFNEWRRQNNPKEKYANRVSTIFAQMKSLNIGDESLMNVLTFINKSTHQAEHASRLELLNSIGDLENDIVQSHTLESE